MILEYLIDTAGREFSADNIIKFLQVNYKNISTETLYTYIDALCKALILEKVYRYDVHKKGILKTLNKYYATDLGIAQIKNHNTEFKNYIVLENIVYNELIVKGYKVYMGKTRSGKIDFIAQRDNETKYIQVTYKLDKEETIKREFEAFKPVQDFNSKYVISLDKKDYSRDNIKHINLIDFLLDDEF